jgi:hypothetical protein
VQGGLNYIDRSKDTHRTQTIYALKNGVDCIRDGDTCAPIPSSGKVPTDLSFSSTSALARFNVPDAMASGVYNSGPVNVSSAPGRIWGVARRSAPCTARPTGVQRRHSHPRQRRSAGGACQAKTPPVWPGMA